jgi:small GTP-binding protein
MCVRERERVMDSPRVFASAKVCICGEPGVGKSSLMRRYCQNTFVMEHKATIGVEFMLASVETPTDGTLKLTIWDLAGQDRFNDIVSSYFDRVNAILFVFDMVDRKTYEALPKWIRISQWDDRHSKGGGSTNRGAKTHTVGYLVANKCDLEEDAHQVGFQEAKAFANIHGLQYAEVSAKANTNVRETFRGLANDVATINKGYILQGKPSIYPAPDSSVVTLRRPKIRAHRDDDDGGGGGDIVGDGTSTNGTGCYC